MLARFWRTFAAILMAGAMGGAALAFSLGVRFTPSASCGSSLSYGSQCPSKSVKNVRIKGFHRKHHKHHHYTFKVTNHNGERVKITMTLVFQTASGKVHHVKKTFRLKAGKSFTLSLPQKAPVVHAARLKLFIQDSSGNTATIKRHFGHFKKHKHK